MNKYHVSLPTTRKQSAPHVQIRTSNSGVLSRLHVLLRCRRRVIFFYNSEDHFYSILLNLLIKWPLLISNFKKKDIFLTSLYCVWKAHLKKHTLNPKITLKNTQNRHCIFYLAHPLAAARAPPGVPAPHFGNPCANEWEVVGYGPVAAQCIII